MEEIISKVWTIKYTPERIEDLILSEENQRYFYPLKELTNNLLFVGSTGCGKTTLAKLLAKKFSPNSYLFINASEESGIDVVRNKISDFVSVMSFDGAAKIVILDEADGISVNAQQALRGVMEEYLDDVKFIITANYKHKLLEAIQSRCQSFEFAVDIRSVVKLLLDILGKENIQLETDDKKAIVIITKQFFPDIRKTLNELQKCCVTGKFIPVYKKDEEVSVTIKTMIDNRTLVWDIRKYVLNNEALFNNDYHFLMCNLFDLFVKAEKVDKVLYIVDSMYKHAIVADPEVNFTGLLINLSK